MVSLQITPPTTDEYTVEVIDLLGSVIYNHQLGQLLQHQSTQHSFPASSQKGVFTVLLRTNKGEISTKKILVL